MKNNRKVIILVSTVITLSLIASAIVYAINYNKKTIAQKSSDQTNTESVQTTSTTSNSTENTQSTDNIKNYFSQANQQPDKVLIDTINSSKKNIDISVYSLTKKEIVNAIIDAKKRGVEVRLITDKQESATKAESAELATIKNNKIPIKVNSHKGVMHLKVAIVDKEVVLTGSYDYTDAASKNNDEVLTVVDDSKIAQDYETQFDRMWNDNKNFSEYK